MFQVWLACRGHQAVSKGHQGLLGAVTCVRLVLVTALQHTATQQQHSSSTAAAQQQHSSSTHQHHDRNIGADNNSIGSRAGSTGSVC
jgi:hypothetical protein